MLMQSLSLLENQTNKSIAFVKKNDPIISKKIKIIILNKKL